MSAKELSSLFLIRKIGEKCPQGLTKGINGFHFYINKQLLSSELFVLVSSIGASSKMLSVLDMALSMLTQAAQAVASVHITTRGREQAAKERSNCCQLATYLLAGSLSLALWLTISRLLTHQFFLYEP